MIKKQDLLKIESFSIAVPVLAGWKCPNQYHTVTIDFSADCNAELGVAIKMKPLNAAQGGRSG